MGSELDLTGDRHKTTYNFHENEENMIKYNASTINYLLLVVFLHFHLKNIYIFF